ncbi:MAG: hypothetical protein R3E86_04880 [Pseudomonadales bacterium]
MTDPLVRAQAKQLERLAELEAAGETVGGWKLGLTSGASRDAFGPGIRPFGYILNSRILPSAATLHWSRIGNGGIENEVCFVIGTDVTAPVDALSVRAAVAGVAPAFEINQRRIPQDSPPEERIADDLAQWGIVVGTPVAVPAQWDQQALTVTLSHDGRRVEQVAARGHIDDHFESLATLANALRAFDRHLRAGDRIITGAFGRANQPASGEWAGDFGAPLGRVTLNIELD